MIWRQRLYQGYISYWLPVALVMLLTGMFWIGDRSLYHKLYYLVLALPTLVVVVCSSSRFYGVVRSPLFILFLLFSIYVMLSLSWASAADYSKLKHPLYICMLILAVASLGEQNMPRLVHVVAVAGVLAGLSALFTIAHYLLSDRVGGERLQGIGALYNPLLTSHVYGFFAVLCLAALMASSRLWLAKIAIFGVLLWLLFLTGSRTPFVALAASVAWLVILVADRRVLWLGAIAGFAAAVGLWLFDSELLARGLSYRPLIWAETWRQIMPALWFGHGYDTGIDIVVSGLDRILADPHNLTLGVIYQTGLVGGLMWLSIYAYSFFNAWRMRDSGLVLISSTLVLYGFMAGMTEGGSFMSRPKEHWFLVWIPIALHLAALRKASATKKAESLAGSERPQRVSTC